MVDPSLVKEVNEFLADDGKVLDGFQPRWVSSSGYRTYQLSWNILEEKTGVTRSHLRISVPEFNADYPSMSLIFRGKPVSRLDTAPTSECKPNPPWAWTVGLPHQVCGSHIHSWQDNRGCIERSGLWELPARRPVEDDVEGLTKMFFWFCDHINVRIQTHNTPIDPPDAGLWSGRC